MGMEFMPFPPLNLDRFAIRFVAGNSVRELWTHRVFSRVLFVYRMWSVKLFPRYLGETMYPVLNDSPISFSTRPIPIVAVAEGFFFEKICFYSFFPSLRRATVTESKRTEKPYWFCVMVCFFRFVNTCTRSAVVLHSSGMDRKLDTDVSWPSGTR